MSDDVWLITNPRAGGGRSRRAAEHASDALAAAGISFRMVQPTSAQGTAEASADAVRAGASVIIACGGDGTVNEVLQSVVDSPAKLAIMPSGSGDDIAMALGLPVHDDAEAAAYIVSAIDTGSYRAVDVGSVVPSDGTARYFLGVLSTGFDSAVNERANTMSRFGGQRYNLAMVRELASFVPAPYELRLDDEVICGGAMMVAVGNGPSYGGGLRICPNAAVDDGQLDVTWVSAVSKGTLLRVFPSVFKGRHVSHPAVRTFRGRVLAISAPDQVAYADGERVGPLPVHVETRPLALRVLSG